MLYMSNMEKSHVKMQHPFLMLQKKKTQKLAVHAVGCAHDSGKKRNVLIVSICLPIGVGFTLRSNTHRAVKVLGMREGPVLLHVGA